jgi:hypothetical protein
VWILILLWKFGWINEHSRSAYSCTKLMEDKGNGRWISSWWTHIHCICSGTYVYIPIKKLPKKLNKLLLKLQNVRMWVFNKNMADRNVWVAILFPRHPYAWTTTIVHGIHMHSSMDDQHEKWSDPTHLLLIIKPQTMVSLDIMIHQSSWYRVYAQISWDETFTDFTDWKQIVKI